MLVVDDDPMFRLLLTGVLGQEAFDVTEARDGAEAVALVQGTAPDLVILDVIMPNLDGYETCRRLRARPECADVPVLMLTSLDDVRSFRLSFEAGATDFATKPISPALLVHRVHFMLRASATLAELRQSELRLAEAQRIARLGHWELDPDSRSFRGSSQTGILLGRALGADATLEDFLACLHEGDRGDVRRAFELLTSGERGLDCRYRVAGEDPRFVHLRGEAARNGSGNLSIRGTVQDVTADVRSEDRVQRLAYQDAVTGLPNRLFFDDRLRAALGQAKRRGSRLAAMLLDLNDFRRVNNSLGHGAGDFVLAEVARRLRDVVREQDEVTRASAGGATSTVARWGGDEFLFALGEITQGEDAAVVASRILEALQAPISHAGQEIFLSGSIGISLFPDDATENADLIRHADIALHQAKEAGRNTFAFYSSAMNEQTMVRLVLEAGLRRALGTDEMSVHYQPLVDARDDRIMGAEALTRWCHPQLGSISPEQFVPLAERLGVINELTEHTLRRVCSDMRSWSERGLLPLYATINISAHQFRNPNLPAVVSSVVRNAGMAPGNFMLEVTEGVLIEDLVAGERMLGELRALGFRIAIDDFGTGYSSLSYLKRFTIDVLKIDRTFVRDIATSERGATLAAGIVALAHGLGVEPVAEGVETVEQRDILLACGCFIMQGYLFARPMPAESLAALLKLGPGALYPPITDASAAAA